MIHSSFQVRGLHLLLIVVETLWCHIFVDSDTYSLAQSLTHVLPCTLFPEFKLVARLRLFPPTQASTSLRASTHTAVTHLSFPHVPSILAQAKNVTHAKFPISPSL